MRDIALQLARSVPEPAKRLNVLREYVQACVLRSLHESEAFRCLSFVGGTALRFLHGLGRFSEDLDFSLESPDGYQPVPWLRKVKRDLSLAGFDVTLSWNDRKTVQVAWVRLTGLLQDVGLSEVASKKLSVKLEIDSHPPTGAVTQVTLVQRHFILALRHHDLPSLMAGKLHALATRKYDKGRDWYDLLWYRSRRPPVEPNLLLLERAFEQTHRGTSAEAREWRRLLRQRLMTLDVGALRDDVAPFLETPADRGLLTKEYLASVLAE